MVIYRNDPAMIRNAAASFLQSPCANGLVVIDNSPTDELRRTFSGLPVIYHSYGENVGYGRGHNWGVDHIVPSKYHLVLNPDILIPEGTLEALIAFMEQNPEVGIACPKILNPDGTLQYLNKRYPSVFVLFARRFPPKFPLPFFKAKLDSYEMRDVGYGSVCDVEFTTGCFMFCRTSVLKQVGGFDPRYFLHLEDCDLGRMVQKAGYRTVYFPGATVTHEWGREPHKNYRMLFVMVISMFRYFNKWGWKWW